MGMEHYSSSWAAGKRRVSIQTVATDAYCRRNSLLEEGEHGRRHFPTIQFVQVVCNWITPRLWKDEPYPIPEPYPMGLLLMGYTSFSYLGFGRSHLQVWSKERQENKLHCCNSRLGEV
jgi:hypothetical protein